MNQMNLINFFNFRYIDSEFFRYILKLNLLQPMSFNASIKKYEQVELHRFSVYFDCNL